MSNAMHELLSVVLWVITHSTAEPPPLHAPYFILPYTPRPHKTQSQTDHTYGVVRTSACLAPTEIIAQLLASYNKLRVPEPERHVDWPLSQAPLQVTVNAWLQSISGINDQTSEFHIDLYMNEVWQDPALKFDHMSTCRNNITLDHDIFAQLWNPNSCFVNSKTAGIHYSPFPNIWVMLYDNGTVWANYRMNISGPCDLDLHNFPMDSVRCELIFESFNYNSAEVEMWWRAWDPVVLWTSDTATGTTTHVSYADFDLIEMSTNKTRHLYKAGYWDELILTFVFKRRTGWYFLQAYVPSLLIIFVSWINFYLGVGALPARTMIAVHSLIALFSQFGSIISNLPRVSYVKAIDVWMLGCSAFVFGSLIELSVVGYLSAHRYDKVKKISGRLGVPEIDTGSFSSLQDAMNMTSQANAHKTATIIMPTGQLDALLTLFTMRQKHRTRVHLHKVLTTIDYGSAVMFPVCFALFNLSYWTYYR